MFQAREEEGIKPKFEKWFPAASKKSLVTRTRLLGNENAGVGGQGDPVTGHSAAFCQCQPVTLAMQELNASKVFQELLS